MVDPKQQPVTKGFLAEALRRQREAMAADYKNRVDKVTLELEEERARLKSAIDLLRRQAIRIKKLESRVSDLEGNRTELGRIASKLPELERTARKFEEFARVTLGAAQEAAAPHLWVIKLFGEYDRRSGRSRVDGADLSGLLDDHPQIDVFPGAEDV